MFDLNDLFYFVKVVDCKGFASAAREIDIQKSKLSRRVAALEQRLGVRLIQRSTRKFTVTELGLEYYEHCAAMLLEAEAAESIIHSSKLEPQGIIKFTCPPSLGKMGVNHLLAEFMSLHPKVVVQLESTNRVVDPLGDGVDVALRVRFPPLVDDGFVVKILAKSAQRLVGSPKLLGEGYADLVVSDLGRFPTMGLSPARKVHEWIFVDNLDKKVSFHHKPKFVTSDIDALHRAALLGVGIVQLPEVIVREDLAAGRLVEILPESKPMSGIVHAVFASQRGVMPTVRVLLDFLLAGFTAMEVGGCL